MDNKVKYWLDISEEDISVAQILLDGGKLLYCGFMCHQVVEKALKALISRDCRDGEMPPKIHNLVRLSEIANLEGKLTESQEYFLEDLNPLHVETRYPEYKSKIAATLSKESCTKLLADAEDFLCWIKEQL